MPEYDLFKLINTSIVSKPEMLESDFRVSESTSNNPKLLKVDSYYMWISCDDEKSRENHIRGKQKVKSGRELCERRVDVLGPPVPSPYGLCGFPTLKQKEKEGNASLQWHTAADKKVLGLTTHYGVEIALFGLGLSLQSYAIDRQIELGSSQKQQKLAS